MSSHLDKVLEDSRLKRQAHRRPPRGAGPARASAAMSSPQAGSSGLGRDQVSSYQDFYRHNRDIVYACVRVIYKRCSGQPFRLAKTSDKAIPMERRVAKDYLPGHLKSLHARVDVLDGHPFLDLLDRPNPVMVRSTLLQMTVASLEITGRSYWWMGGDKDPSNWSILPLPAHWVEPVHRPGMLYARWKVRIPGSSDDIEVPGDEIAYFYYPDPSNPLASLSPLQAASQAILTGESIDNSHRQAFNMGIGGSVVVKVARTAGVAGQEGSRAELGRAQREQLMRAFMEHYAGVLKQNYPIILDGIFEDVKRISQSNREMDFLQSKKLTNQIICMIFGVNPIVLGMLESANRSSSATAEDHLANNVVNPILILLGEVINAQVLPFFMVGDARSKKNGQSRVTGYFEPAHAYDPDLDQSRLKLLFQTGGARVNEARTQLGFPPVPGGNVAWRPQNLEPYNLDEEFDFTPPEDATVTPPPVPDIFGGTNLGAPPGAPTPAVPAAPERNGTVPMP